MRQVNKEGKENILSFFKVYDVNIVVALSS